MAEKPTYRELEQKLRELEQAQRDHERSDATAQAHRRLVETMEKIDQGIQSSDSVERMLDKAMEVVLKAFQCDRAWLFHPCNPDAYSFSVTVESTTADYPGAKALGMEVPMTGDMAGYCHRVLAAPGQVVIDPPDGEEMANDIAIKFNVKTLMLMALHPKVGDSWMFGVHQCDHQRKWTEEDKRLFRRIGFRLTDALSTKLYIQQLEESEEKYRRLAENLPDIIYRMSLPDGRYEYINPAVASISGYPPEAWYNNPNLIREIIPSDWHSYFEKQWKRLIEGDASPGYELPIVHKDGIVRWIYQRNILLKDAQGQPIAVEGIVTDITDRKKAEDVLRKHSVIIESTPDAVITTDVQGNITSWNKGAEKIYGYRSGEVLGKPISIIYKEENLPVLESMISDLWEGKDIPSIECTCTDKDGNDVHILLSLTTIADQDGNVVEFVGFTKDITERKRVEEQMRDTNDKLNALIQSSPLAIIALDPEGTVTLWNPAAEKMLGWKQEEVIGHFFPLVPDERKGEHDTLRQGVLQGKGFSEVEVCRKRKDGSDIYISVSTVPLKDADGRISGILSVNVDITEHKQAENEIKKQKQLFETMFNTIPDGVVITNMRREIRLANQGMESTFGYKPNELVGKTTEMLYAHRDDYVQAGKAVFDKTAKNEGVLYVTSYRNKAGYEFSGETFGAKLFDENGRWIGNLGVMRDITERKHLESQLRQSQKMQAMGTLAGGIAHDFNNILTPVIIQTELALLNATDDGPLRTSLQEILEAGYRAKNLVKQILTFSRQTEAQQVPLAVSPIVKEALKLLRSTLPATIKIEKHLDEETGNVLADPTQIHQVLMNLCTNAAHAMWEKGGVLKVSLSEIDVDVDEAQQDGSIDAGRYVRLTVADTGHGIAPSLKERIFEPFFTTKDRSEGTGMGLSVVHGILKGCGGDISVESEPEQGTTFTILLPSTPRKTRHVSAEGEALPGGSEQVLVVDDELPMVKSVEGILTKLGYRVVSRTSSIQALEEFKASPEDYDLVITDQTMPNMTGVELSRALLTVREDLPIILCTGFSDLVDEEKAKKEGIKRYLLKPLVVKEMANAVRSALDG